jgi:hypothetical protein
MAGARRRGGKDAVYAGCELEPMQWSATGAVSPLRQVFLGSLDLFLSSPVLQFNLLTFTTSTVRTRAFGFGARFMLLSVGAGS